MENENLYTFENPEYRKTFWHTCSHIMAQANYVKDADGVTYCELPDVAIVNDVRFVWEDNKLYMEWEGCDDGQNVYFI